MDIFKRYWEAMDETSRKAIKKATFTALAMNLALLTAYLIVYFDVLFLGKTGDSAALQLALWPAFMLGIAAIAIYQCVLVFRAHKAIKENLFAHPAPGFRARETWTHVDGLILALALIGLTSIPSVLAGFVIDGPMIPSPAYEPTFSLSSLIQPIIGLVLAPVAAKRYIPLPASDQESTN